MGSKQGMRARVEQRPHNGNDTTTTVTDSKVKVLMFGPSLSTTSGISAVVNHWLEADIDKRLQLNYISTLDNYVPGQYFRKIANALRAYGSFLFRRVNPPDLVHIHLSYGMSFYRKLGIFLIARLRGLKTVIHLHGSIFKEFYQDGGWLRRRLIRYLFDNATAVMVLSKAWKDFVQGISRNRHIRIVHNCAMLASQQGQGGKQTAHSRQISITFMGRLGQRKGVYDLLMAFVPLSQQVPEAHLVLGGDGEIETVKQRVESLGLEGRVSVLGWVSGRAKDQVFENADIYVLPSYNEGLPGSILEAMAVGKPIVSTPVGGIPEAVIPNLNGYLVAPGDVADLQAKLLALCRDEELRGRMGEASRSLVAEKFDVHKVVNSVVGLYEEIRASNV